MKQALRTFTAALAAGWVLAGCISPNVIPATSLDCYVLDARTGTPLQGAWVRMLYEGPFGEVIEQGSFSTDENGFARVQVEKRVIWMKGTDLGFAGGYHRRLQVTAHGYEPNGRAEQFNRGLLEREAPFTFRMERLRNRFGAVRVLKHERNADREELLLEVLDGPHRGAQQPLPIIPRRAATDLTSRKLYLRQALDEIRDTAERFRVRAFSFDEVLREGLEDEPYDP